MNEVTQLLFGIREGDRNAAEELLRLVYDELRKIAAQRLAEEKPGQTLQATALVHEAYLRLVGTPQWRNLKSREHFLAAASEAMRRILVDQARRKLALKHGGGCQRQEIWPDEVAQNPPPAEIIAVHEALEELAAEDALAAELVKMHYFGGFSLEEAGELLQISRATAYRLWTFARAWLRATLEAAGDGESARI